jgi:hypothetical protein
METEKSTKIIAENIVALLSEKTQKSLKQAAAVLAAFFVNQPAHLARAYELAWLVTLKREAARKPHVSFLPSESSADWMAIQASKCIEVGNLPQAFSLLRAANNSGSRKLLCRSVLFQLFRRLAPEDQILTISNNVRAKGFFDPSLFVRQKIRSISTINVGRVKNSGVVAVRSGSSTFESGRGNWVSEKKRTELDEGEFILKSSEDLRSDLARGVVALENLSSSRGSVSGFMDRINWCNYFERLSEERNSGLLGKLA